MNKICTSIEQSQKLIELGISYDTADMIWATIYDENHMVSDYRLDVIPCRLYSGNAIPAWSLSALIDLMPDKILINNESYYLSFTKERVSFRGPVTWDGQKAKSFEMDNIFDAAFEMVCWLKENGKI